MASGRLVDYLGSGLIAARPVTPVLITAGLGLWYATDTNTLSAWDGATWENVTGSVASVNGATGTVVLDAGDIGITDVGGYFTGTDVEAALQELGASSGGATGVTINTYATAHTMDPATDAGLAVYNRCADDVTFNTSQSYTAGEVYNVRATAALTLIGTGVTLTPPAGGTLDMDADMAVTVIMTSSTAGDVIGQTVPV